MTKEATFIEIGEAITYTNPSAETAIAAGEIVALGWGVGVAMANIAASATGVLQIAGVFAVTAVNNATFAIGDPLYWDDSAGKVTKVVSADSGDAYIGVAFAAKAETATTAYVKINVGFPAYPSAFLPSGGTTGQVLTKNSATAQDASWAAIHQVPAGGTTGQVLKKVSDTDYDVAWAADSVGT